MPRLTDRFRMPAKTEKDAAKRKSPDRHKTDRGYNASVGVVLVHTVNFIVATAALRAATAIVAIGCDSRGILRFNGDFVSGRVEVGPHYIGGAAGQTQHEHEREHRYYGRKNFGHGSDGGLGDRECDDGTICPQSW